jgi:predicted porin
MQKKIVALAVAGLSTAAFAQTNVTIYGVADVAMVGTTMTQGKAVQDASGSTFNAQSNSSLLGFKGTEDLGNGLKALFQFETGVEIEGTRTGGNYNTGSLWGNQRDSFLGLDSKYGLIKAGYNSTPFRATVTSFDVLPGATGPGAIETMVGEMRFGTGSSGGALAYDSVIRATSVAYAMPTLYGFNGSLAYTGSGNNGQNNQEGSASSCSSGQGQLSACTATPQSAWGFNLGWTGFGVNLQGAFQQANYNLSGAGTANLGDFTSYTVGASYTGIPGLKLSNVYVRNSLGTNGTSALTSGAGKISNNQYWVGASYRMGNWEPLASAAFSSDMDGSTYQQLGSRMWTARANYYLSKRTMVYGLVSNVNNSANQNYTSFVTQSALTPTGGQNLFTYGLGMRTNF